jgi:hypothetical protein
MRDGPAVDRAVVASAVGGPAAVEAAGKGVVVATGRGDR